MGPGSLGPGNAADGKSEDDFDIEVSCIVDEASSLLSVGVETCLDWPPCGAALRSKSDEVPKENVGGV